MRDFTPSLRNTLRKWYSTVLGLMNKLLAAVWVALDAWQRDGGKSDLLALFDRATDALAAFAGELSVWPADPS